MAEPTPTPTPGGNGDPTPTPVAASYTKEQVDSAAAAARREAEKELKETNDRLTVLEAQEKERVEAELSETEKLKIQIDEINLELDSHKKNTEWRTGWETKEAEAIEKEMEELSDNHKTIVNGLPLESRRLAIQEFKAFSINPSPEFKKGIKQKGKYTMEEVLNLKIKHGVNSPEYIAANKEYQENK